jgi:hypothetical protein
MKNLKHQKCRSDKLEASSRNLDFFFIPFLRMVNAYNIRTHLRSVHQNGNLRY